jgi:hypothetical protein
MNRHLIIAGAAGAALVASSGGLALASAGDGNAQSGPAAAARATDGTNVIRCDGGRQKNIRTRIVNTPFQLNETPTGVDTPVPGANLSFVGPTAGTDTVVVTFSGETRLFGGEPDDWMGIEVKLDGANIQPYTAVGDVMALNSEDSWNMHSAQFCVTVKPGRHRLQVFTNFQDNGTDNSLRSWLDDYTASFERYE